jgi:hypothetical protein
MISKILEIIPQIKHHKFNMPQINIENHAKFIRS